MSSITPDNKVFVVVGGGRPRAHCVALLRPMFACAPLACSLLNLRNGLPEREPAQHNKLQTATLTKRRSSRRKTNLQPALRLLIRKKDYLPRSIGRIWGFGRSSSAVDCLDSKIEMIREKESAHNHPLAKRRSACGNNDGRAVHWKLKQPFCICSV